MTIKEIYKKGCKEIDKCVWFPEKSILPFAKTKSWYKEMLLRKLIIESNNKSV